MKEIEKKMDNKIFNNALDKLFDKCEEKGRVIDFALATYNILDYRLVMISKSELFLLKNNMEFKTQSGVMYNYCSNLYFRKNVNEEEEYICKIEDIENITYIIEDCTYAIRTKTRTIIIK